MQESRSSHLPVLFPPRTIWVLGAGRFGFLAAQRLSRRHGEASFLVIDSQEEKLDRIGQDLGLAIHHEDALTFLSRTQVPDSDRTWIIPAVPVHVAFQWLRTRMERFSTRLAQVPVPECVDDRVPNPYRTPAGTVYASFATFLCPDACNEPDEICTSTGKARPGNLFEELSRIEAPGFRTEVIRSWQLAPGVGGYPASSLESAFLRIAGKSGGYLVATSCRCHGVIDALQWNGAEPDSGLGFSSTNP